MLVLSLRLGLSLGLLVLGLGPAPAQLFVTTSPSAFANNPAPNTVTFGWNASPSPEVLGYYLDWGLVAGQRTNRMDAGHHTQVRVGGWQTNIIYYLSVTAYGQDGRESDPSEELQYVLPATEPVVPVLELGIERYYVANNPSVRLHFEGRAGDGFELQATTDFRRWETIWATTSRTNGRISFTVPDVQKYPHRFFRLQSVAPGPPRLILEMGGVAGNSVAMRLSFPGDAGATYAIQATTNLQHWTTIWTTNCAENARLVFAVPETANHPRRFFRLLMED